MINGISVVKVIPLKLFSIFILFSEEWLLLNRTGFVGGLDIDTQVSEGRLCGLETRLPVEVFCLYLVRVPKWFIDGMFTLQHRIEKVLIECSCNRIVYAGSDLMISTDVCIGGIAAMSTA